MAPTFSLLFLALAGFTVAALVRGRRTARGFVRINPTHRGWLRRLRLVDAEDFLRLEAVIVSGHIGRQVGRLTLSDGADVRTVYLKRETQVRWRTRLTNFLAGFGWVSRCVREAGVLQALEREELTGPRWLATGEDDQGRAFLLVEEVVGAEPLMAVLGRLDGEQRRALAVRLGRLLARLHQTGFFHRDLYAKHVLVRDETLCLLDWQRAWRGAWVPYLARVRDLATLHATLPDAVTGLRDRLTLLRAYLGPTVSVRLLRRYAVDVEACSRQLQKRRHIREKRQPPTAEPQNWICHDGEALCVTPAMAALMGGESLDWLRLDRQPVQASAGSRSGRELSRRWLVLPGQRYGLLVRRRMPIRFAQILRHWLLGSPLLTPEQREATLLWRLERHGVPAPRVLGFGRRVFAWNGQPAADSRPTDRGGLPLFPRWQDSFLLSEPFLGTVRLPVWLAQARDDERRGLLHQLGTLLARLHDACCYLDTSAMTAFAVRPPSPGTDAPATLVLEHIDGIQPARRPNTILASRDLAGLQTYLSAHGCTLADWRMVLQGHADALPRMIGPAVGTVRYDAGGREGTEDASASDPAVPSLWQRLTRGWCRLRQDPVWTEFAGPGWADRIMQMPVTDRYSEKQGRSSGRLRLDARDRSGRSLVVYLKRHYQLPWWRRVLALLWPGSGWSPALQEYEHLRWAHGQGVPVPPTVAAGEFVGPWGRLQSFLAVEELTGMLPLDEALPRAAAQLPAAVFRRWKRGLAAEVARLARLLHDRRHFHKDLYLCHFFVRETDIAGMAAADDAAWRGRVYLIDLHRLAHHRWTWWLWRLKDLAQLLYSADLPCLDVRDKLAFWMQYRGLGVRGWASRLLRLGIVFKWRRYQRHNCRKTRQAGTASPDG
ncbi:MAG: lipopolysaccharide kinase InaA family protein [Gemmataceae bacterium]